MAICYGGRPLEASNITVQRYKKTLSIYIFAIVVMDVMDFIVVSVMKWTIVRG
jgi:hypothetical protein